MGEKNIFVNATAATEGGILTILRQFKNEVELKNELLTKYYFFVSCDIYSSSENIIIVNDIKGKKKIDRIKWDLYGMEKWAEKNHIQPNLIVSLQNTGVIFRGIPQIVYIHQSLPYAKESKWSILKKDERKLWIYKNIFKLWISITVKKRAHVVVQTEWMKQALIYHGFMKEKIIISRPNLENIKINEIHKLNINHKFLFYPAADYKYKNHIIIIKAIKKIMEENNSLLDNFKVIFTLDKKSEVYNIVSKYGIENYFEFVGNLSYKDIMSYYKSCQAVLFPSFVETLGLPLIEGSRFGKKILVSDCQYSREVLKEYKLKSFILFDDEDQWKKEIINSLNDYSEERFNIRDKIGWNSMFELIKKVII